MSFIPFGLQNTPLNWMELVAAYVEEGGPNIGIRSVLLPVVVSTRHARPINKLCMFAGTLTSDDTRMDCHSVWLSVLNSTKESTSSHPLRPGCWRRCFRAAAEPRSRHVISSQISQVAFWITKRDAGCHRSTSFDVGVWTSSTSCGSLRVRNSKSVRSRCQRN